MALAELQIVAGLVTALAVGLLLLAVRVMYPKKVDDVDESLEAMINGFDFELPEEIEMYRKVKEEHPDEPDVVFNMLFRRAVADIPLIRKIQSESAGIQRLKKNDILKDGSFLSYKMAEELINEEINDVRREAEELKPGEGWPDKIFPQAVQFMNHMAEQQMAAQQKAQQEQMQAMQAAMQAQTATEAANGTEDEETLRKRK
uniref:Preprotein translocase subunit Sec66 n=1 Tax=Globisporangium ultimum (strain ATCC 200006 / CBS 805.95 / DAOM BR144) TaxID=431595 RepID=K3XA85_GLOUD